MLFVCYFVHIGSLATSRKLAVVQRMHHTSSRLFWEVLSIRSKVSTISTPESPFLRLSASSRVDRNDMLTCSPFFCFHTKHDHSRSKSRSLSVWLLWSRALLCYRNVPTFVAGVIGHCRNLHHSLFSVRSALFFLCYFSVSSPSPFVL